MNNYERTKFIVSSKIQYERKSRVYFKDQDRIPQFGIFLDIASDFNLKEKGYVRFLSDSKAEAYERTGNIGYTRLFKIDSISDIQIF